MPNDPKEATCRTAIMDLRASYHDIRRHLTAKGIDLTEVEDLSTGLPGDQAQPFLGRRTISGNMSTGLVLKPDFLSEAHEATEPGDLEFSLALDIEDAGELLWGFHVTGYASARAGEGVLWLVSDNHRYVERLPARERALIQASRFTDVHATAGTVFATIDWVAPWYAGLERRVSLT